MKTRKLNRDSQARSALFKGLASSLIEKEEITTTVAKAKAVKSIFEKMLTKARTGTVAARRQIHSVLGHDPLVKKIVDEIAPRYKGVNGGYTKLVYAGTRKGDGAPLAKLSLTKKSAPSASPTKTGKTDKTGKSNKAPKKAAPQVAAPRVAKPTQTANVASSKSAIGTKRGER